MSRKARVLIVDDHAIVRQGLKCLIQDTGDFTVKAEAESGPQALSLLAECRPDVAIVDLSLPGMSGVELIKHMKSRLPSLPILVLSVHDEALYAERSLRAGAKGYIMKTEAASKVIQALREVLAGKLFMAPAVRERMLSAIAENRPDRGGTPVDWLSDREFEVFQLIGRGYKSAQVAQALNICVKTVESYREQMKIKLNFEHSSELTQYAIEWVHSEQGDRRGSS